MSVKPSRLVAGATALAMAGIPLAGCAAGDGRETIRFTFSKREVIEFMTQLVADYNAAQSRVRVVIDTSGVDVVSASFVRGNPPDIMLANYKYEIARFVQRCALTDLTGTDAAASVRDDLQPLEVAEIPAEERQDPTFFRTGGEAHGRDGCRVPLPWTASGPSFGFGAGGAHLPQPAWFAAHAADVEGADPASTLSTYREALRLRRALQADESLEWIETGRADVLRFARPNGWQVVTNFGTAPFDLGADADDVVLGVVGGSAVPAETTVWIVPAALRG